MITNLKTRLWSGLRRLGNIYQTSCCGMASLWKQRDDSMQTIGLDTSKFGSSNLNSIFGSCSSSITNYGHLAQLDILSGANSTDLNSLLGMSPRSGTMKETDPHGKGQHEKGAKNDAGKPDLSLLVMFGKALSEVGHVGTKGAIKYSRGGWQHVPDGENRYTAAMLRHLFAENQSLVDDDTGCYHAAQVAWNALARLELILRRLESNETNNA